MNYVELFQRSVIKNQDKVALVDQNGKRGISFKNIDILSDKVSGKLHSLGAKKGDFIVVNLDRCSEYAISYIGIMKCGCVVVPVLPSYPKNRTDFIIEQTGAKIVIDEKFFKDLGKYDKYIDLADGKDPMLLVYTSGSTGNPKGILHSVRNITNMVVRYHVLYEGLDELVYVINTQFVFIGCINSLFAPIVYGGTVHIVPEETRKSQEKLAEYFEANNVTMCGISPQILRFFSKRNTSLKRFLCGGERMTNIYFDSVELINTYGMTEAGLVSAFKVDKPYENTPVGKPFEGIELLILDEKDNRVPRGQEGEICYRGIFDTVYFKNEELTKKTFHRYGDYTIIHSNDIGYIDENGNVVYVNRKDWMIKINGQRVETLEIETVLNKMDDIKDAVIKGFTDKDGQNYLVAYYVTDNKDINGKVLKERLSKILVSYMIPRFFVKLDAIPKNINNKVDRLALKAPDADDYHEEYVEASTDLERKLCIAFEETLKCKNVGVNDDFFALGGDSIKTLKLIKNANIKGLTPNIVFNGKTVKNIAKLCENNEAEQIVHNAIIDGAYKTTSAQKGVYLESLANPNSTMYNIPFIGKLPNDVDVDRFVESIKKVVEAHKIFNTTYRLNDNEPFMYYKHRDVVVNRREIKSLKQECKYFVRPFDLTNGPLYRFELWYLDNKTYFVYDIHHIIFDGSSMQVFLNQIIDAYNGKEIKDEELNIFDISKHEEQLVDSVKYNEAKQYFFTKFDGIDVDSLPQYDIIDLRQTNETGHLEIHCKENISKGAVEDYTKKNAITENTLFLGAFAYTLAKFNGANEVNFVSVNNGRHDTRLSNSIGMFVKTLPLYYSINDKGNVKDYLKNIQDDFFETMSHDLVSLSDLVKDCDISNNIQFVYQAELSSGVKIEDQALYNLGYMKTDLAGKLQAMLFKDNEGYHLRLNYDADLYSEALMRNFASMYFNVVDEMMHSNTLNEIDYIDIEQYNLIEKYNDTKVEYNQNLTILDLFNEQVQLHPNNECLVYLNNKYSYLEVDIITNRLATYLVSKGIKHEDVVGVLIPRSEYMLIAALGVLKAGGAYMPLDPSYPSDRINLMMTDSNAKLLITTRELRDVVDDKFKGETLYVDEIKTLYEEMDLSLIKHNPHDLFVLLYTSGSTGVPKGVMYEHKNVLCLALWQKKYFNYGIDSKIGAYASYGFDANVYDMYATIISGSSLHIIPEEIRLDLNAIKDYFNDSNITHSVMTTQVARQFAQMSGCKTLKYLTMGGEALTPFDPTNEFKVFNLYGPSEGTVLVSGFEVDKKYKNVPIGKVVDNVKLYIVDNNGKLLPPGGVGELLIAGPHVTRGYLNKEEKTNEVYTRNMFSDDPDYSRVYHTGDVVRLMPDGNYQFVGRSDMQVKIRGFRIELTEVEEIIRRFKGVKDATVVAYTNDGGEKYLCAYVVSSGIIDEEGLKNFIRSEKPSYMVPGVIMQINKIPLTQNQKVNKKALPAPKFKSVDVIKPRNEVEQAIFDILKDILGHDEFGIDSDIFNCGLTSIGTVRLNVELAERFDVSVKTQDIQANPTVRSLEKFLLKNNKVDEEYEKLSSYPLTANQLGVFVECNNNPNTLTYNIPLLFKIKDGVGTYKIIETLKTVCDKHPYIKMRLSNDDKGNVIANRNDNLNISVKVTRTKEINKVKDIIKPFTLMNSPLYRFEIFETNNGNYLFVDFHHLIFDGTSMSIFLNDFELAFEEKEIKAETYSGYELALDEKQQANNGILDKAKGYYDQLFLDAEVDCLPNKCKDAIDNGTGPSTIKESLKIDIDSVNKYCKKHNFTQNAYFNSVFSIVLSRFINRQQVVYTTIYNGRNDSRLANVVAMLVKTLPVVVRFDDKITSDELVDSVQKELLNNMTYDCMSFVDISNKYNLKSDVLFVYQGENFGKEKIKNSVIEYYDSLNDEAKAPITFEVSINEGRYNVTLNYKKDMFNETMMQCLIDSFVECANNLCSSNKVKDISILDNHSKTFIDRMNDTDKQFRNISLGKLFEEVAINNPNKVALICRNESLTYEELNLRANRVAHYLISSGVKNNDIVSIVLDRTVDLIVVELGILKAGGAFLAMLPSYPDDRIEYCLKDSNCKYVITSDDIKRERKDLFNINNDYLTITIDDLMNIYASSNPNVDIHPNDLAYCIYTSGSTGTPKGVMIEHHNVSNFIQTAEIVNEIYNVPGEDIVSSSFASVSFDMSIYEIYSSLCHGDTLVMATEDEIHNPNLLIQLLNNHKVNTIICTPTFITNMIDINDFASYMKNVRTLLLGAEAFPNGLFEKLKGLSPNINIYNGYGPTECTIACSCKKLNSGNNITIGGPARNTKFYVIDKYGNINPPYANGELIICGECVGRGYINLPEKNKLAFFSLNGIPAYHSGDIVRVNADGEIEFFGRNDNQVKLRGYRIELDEIEKSICSYDGINQAKVIVRNNGSEDYLAAYFTAETTIDIEDLTKYLKTSLTYYMVPSAIMQLDVMPLNASGKIDKKALPEITIQKKERIKRAPKRSLEEQLCEIFKNALGLEEFYVNDNFFEMGGTSISASKVTMQLMSMNIDVQYQNIFDNPTPELLAEFIEGTRRVNVIDTNNTSDDEESPYKEILQYNTLEYADKLNRHELGDVFLCGSTGFLGIHVLAELISSEKGHIYCLARKGKYDSALERLKKLVMYYFDDTFDEEFENRITIIDGDITDDNLVDLIKDIKFDTIINCAACVKHYAADDILEKINVSGVENLVNIALSRNVAMTQISTTSIPGMHNEETYRISKKMHENELFVVDDIGNKYIISKYHGELKVFEGIKKGLRGKVIRVGNLMGRASDGEFQFNMNTNAFLNGLRGFATIGKCPVSHSTDKIGFSPIDLTAKAVVLLAGTNDEFTAFNADNRYSIDEYQLIESMNNCGLSIERLEDKEYYDEYHRLLADEKINSKLSGLMTNDRPDLHPVETDNRFTASILYRLGFSWNIIDNDYIIKAINSIKTLGFFDLEDDEEM